MTFEDDLLALERRVLVDAAGDLFRAVDDLRRMLVMEEPGIGRRLASIAVSDFEAVIRNGILDARQLGAQQALDDLRSVDTSPAEVAAGRRAAADVATAALVAPVTGLFALVAGAISTGLILLATGSPADEALAPVFGAANTTRNTVTAQVNKAANQSVRAVGDRVGKPLVWQAERDACVYCLALAGEVVGIGEVFPDADRYAAQPKAYGPILEPPRHPNCRCTLAVLLDDSYAVSLRREADRSILRGFSLRTESNAVRIRAAERLLGTRGLDAPKSVIAYAERSVRNGKFARGRAVSAEGPRLVVT